MKTLIALLLVTLGLGGAYWKVQHPNATVDDIKVGAASTIDRAKFGFDTFRNGSSAIVAVQEPVSSNQQQAGQQDEKQAILAEQIGAVETRLGDRLSAIESNVKSLDSTVINGRLTDAERRMDASDQKLSEMNQNLVGLAEDLETVSSSLGNLNDNVASSAGQGDQYTTEMDSINQRLGELTNDLAEQNAEQTLTNIGTRIDSIDSQLNALESSNSGTLGELAATLASVSDQSTALESRINTLSIDASSAGGNGDNGNLNAQIDQRLQEMEAKLATANSDNLRIDNLMEQLSVANEQIRLLTAAQSNSSGSDTQLASLLEQAEANKTQNAALEQRLNESSAEIASLTEELSALKDQSSNNTVESLQAELNEQLSLLENRIENTDDSTDISTLNQSLATTRNRIQLLESRVQDLPSDGETAQAAQDAQNELQAQIAAMEERLRALPQQTDPELLNTLNQVQAEVAELRDRSAAEVIEYKVYFGPSSTEISDEAAVVLKSFIKQEQNRTTGVNIYGFTDRRGDASFNQRLALQRATAVRSFLIQNGFDFTKIKSLSGLGEDAAAVTLDDGAEDADQRTVVLVADQP